MWCVVVFKDDDSVEAVPSHWYKNNKCAWPRKNAKRMIERRAFPNEIEFDYLKARKLSNKDYDSYTIARNKAKRSELTSDLSTTELSEATEKLPRAKTSKRMIGKNKKYDYVDMWSPASCDDLIIEQEESVSGTTKHSLNTSMELNIVNAGTTPTSLIQKNTFASRPLNVKRKLSFVVEQCNIPESSKLPKGPESASNNVIHTLSSPFKVTNEENIMPQSYSQPLQSSQMESTSLNKRVTKSFDLSTSVIHTSCSPFKVTFEEKNVPQSYLQHLQSSQMESTSVNKKVTNSFDSSTPSQPTEKDKVLELLYKMNRTICNIKYDIMTLSEKIDLVLKSGNNVLGFGELTEEDKVQNEVFENLPLDNEEDLSVFENKLSNQEFRKKITFELKRYAKDSLPSTVRAIMRFLFKDTLLNKFSYKGQKGKKIFYTLTICSVIFDSIKLMKKFCKYDTIEAEKPLSIFISGAKFRDLPKTKTAQSVN